MRNRETIQFAAQLMGLPIPDSIAFLPVSSTECILIGKGNDNLETIAETIGLSGYIATVYNRQLSIVVRKAPESEVWTIEEILAREG